MILELIREVSKDGFQIQESRISVEPKGSYWHVSFLDVNSRPVSGGFAESKGHARKVASAEYIERSFYRNLAKSPSLRKRWGCDIVPTACGFAAGFERNNTIVRSVGEALERWVMSLWIDDGYLLERLDSAEITQSLDNASCFFASTFDEVWFFLKHVTIQVGTDFFQYEIGQTMAFKNGGIFPGSSAQCCGGNVWQHALLESYRHYLGLKNNPVSDEFPANKVKFFGSNSEVAVRQIKKANRENWPVPKISFFNVEGFKDDHFFIARTIIGGWRSWEEGDLERFLY